MPHHDSFARKLAHARLLRDEVGIRRPILVDDLAGTVHRRYGSMPNMTWVIDRGGRVIYKADWTSAANVESFLDRFLHARQQRSGAAVPAMYQTEQIEFRLSDPEQFQQRLRRNGLRAVREFDNARALWGRRSPG